MRPSKIFRWILYVFAGLLAGIISILIVLLLVPVTFDLSNYRGAVESAATSALGRTVKVEEKIAITTSLQPYFSLEGLRIGNPEGFQAGDFLQMEKARLGVRLLPLLSGKIHVTEIKVKGLSVLLVENPEGAVNWTFSLPDGPASEISSDSKPQGDEKELALQSDSLVLENLVLEDIHIDYRNSSINEPVQFMIEECNGTMLPGKPFTLVLKGMLLNEPYKTMVEISSLKELLKENRSRMEIMTDVADTHFEFTGTVDFAQVARSLTLKAAVSGDRLDSLNGLLRLDLPPLTSYRAAAQLDLRKKRADLSGLEIQIGQSKLSGEMSVDNSGTIPESIIELSAPLVRLDDFDVGDWSARKNDSEKPPPEDDEKKKNDAADSKEEQSSADSKIDNILNPEVLGKFDVEMNVTVDKVLSGKDDLGSGSLTANLKEGRFSVDTLKLNAPGGSLSLAASLKPDKKAPEASVRVLVENFDFGVFVRRANPEAVMGGRINLDVDLRSNADSFDKLLANGNGYFDFSGRLENLKAGVIDLWAVNLIAAVVFKNEADASKINCIIGRWSMDNGLLTPDVFLIDTSKIRICGNGQVDFKKEHIDLQMAPSPKKAEYLSLATPIEVKGKFSDFGIGVQAGGFIKTAVNFITSPVTVTFRSLVGKELPEDGEDVCAMYIGPDNRSVNPPAGCK